MRSLWLGVALAFLCAGPAEAAVLVGKVVRVFDGDTITVLDDGKKQHRIRLGGIDAPALALTTELDHLDHRMTDIQPDGARVLLEQKIKHFVYPACV